MTTFLSNREIYERVIRETVPLARERLWIATADIKDMYVDAGGRDMVPFLEVLDGMLKRGVEVRLIHAKEPGPNWREDFDRHPGLWEGMERMLCPRVHFKCIIVDGRTAYFGSANLTGAWTDDDLTATSGWTRTTDGTTPSNTGATTGSVNYVHHVGHVTSNT